LKGLPKLSVHVDNILVTGETEGNHMENLSAVLRRLNDAGSWFAAKERKI